MTNIKLDIGIPEGWDVVGIREPNPGDWVLVRGEPKQFFPNGSQATMLIIEPVKPVHKEPELLYCLMVSDACFHVSDSFGSRPVKRLEDTYELDNNVYDLIMADDDSIWLGHWNNGPKEPELQKNWLCEFWDNENCNNRLVAFFDRMRHSTPIQYFTANGSSWNHCRPIPRHLWPEWAVEAHKTLED